MTFGKTFGRSLSISMCMQHIIRIFQKVQRDRTSSTLIRSWTSANPPPMINVIWLFPGILFVKTIMYAEFYQNITWLKNKGPFSLFFSRIWTSANARSMINDIWQSFWARSCQYQCVSKLSLRHTVHEIEPVRFLFQNLDFGKA